MSEFKLLYHHSDACTDTAAKSKLLKHEPTPECTPIWYIATSELGVSCPDLLRAFERVLSRIKWRTA